MHSVGVRANTLSKAWCIVNSIASLVIIPFYYRSSITTSLVGSAHPTVPAAVWSPIPPKNPLTQVLILGRTAMLRLHGLDSAFPSEFRMERPQAASSRTPVVGRWAKKTVMITKSSHDGCRRPVPWLRSRSLMENFIQTCGSDEKKMRPTASDRRCSNVHVRPKC
jgi:hypothetical protein